MEMKLTDQALGAIMMALQKSLMEQTDIVPVLKDFNFLIQGEAQDQLIVENPPTIKFDQTDETITSDEVQVV